MFSQEEKRQDNLSKGNKWAEDWEVAVSSRSALGSAGSRHQKLCQKKTKMNCPHFLLWVSFFSWTKTHVDQVLRATPVGQHTPAWCGMEWGREPSHQQQCWCVWFQDSGTPRRQANSPFFECCLFQFIFLVGLRLFFKELSKRGLYGSSIRIPSRKFQDPTHFSTTVPKIFVVEWLMAGVWEVAQECSEVKGNAAKISRWRKRVESCQSEKQTSTSRKWK